MKGEEMLKELSNPVYDFEETVFNSDGIGVTYQRDRLSGQRLLMLSMGLDACDYGQAADYLKTMGKNPRTLPFKGVVRTSAPGIGFMFMLPSGYAPISAFRSTDSGKAALRRNAVAALAQVAGILKASPGSSLCSQLMFINPADFSLAVLPWPSFLIAPKSIRTWMDDRVVTSAEQKEAYTAAAFFLYALEGLAPGNVELNKKNGPYHEIVRRTINAAVSVEHLMKQVEKCAPTEVFNDDKDFMQKVSVWLRAVKRAINLGDGPKEPKGLEAGGGSPSPRSGSDKPKETGTASVDKY
jgi:hypothetical protein